MQFNTLFFLVVASCLCLALANANYEDCCLKYVKTLSPLIQKKAVKYRMQVTDGGCNIPAVVFTMKKGRVYCANPSDDWVIKMMNAIDKNKNNDGKKTHGKGKVGD
ncbi:hypothetical protein L3Q82_021287 [Scortum barcoo]|uniref:Uncharacterized protein n=1 Tax=Scortum barcoo TaxID=214431 RepID=A0ACB8X3Q8_9TELE|nr:hypothetical protein L3Q82_021287 [Scortum barcoo]